MSSREKSFIGKVVFFEVSLGNHGSDGHFCPSTLLPEDFRHNIKQAIEWIVAIQAQYQLITTFRYRQLQSIQCQLILQITNKRLSQFNYLVIYLIDKEFNMVKRYILKRYCMMPQLYKCIHSCQLFYLGERQGGIISDKRSGN